MFIAASTSPATFNAHKIGWASTGITAFDHIQLATFSTVSSAHAIKYFKDGPYAKPNAHFAEFMWRDLSGAVVMDRDMIREVAERARIGR